MIRPLSGWRAGTTRKLIVVLCGPVILAAASAAFAQEAYVRVVDVGQGLCVVAKEPSGKALLYDAGYSGELCGQAVNEIIGSGPLDLVVISHSDSDHISDGDEILAAHGAKLIIHPEDDRTSDAIVDLRTEIARQATAGATVRSMLTNPPTFGEVFSLGGAQVTFVAGWRNGAETARTTDPALPEPDRKNALSLVIRFEYGGHSVLLTGDTIGRRRRESNRACRNAERIMARGAVPIQSDVLIGQHHGGDNATSNCFIRAVKPSWVIFSAGRGHAHPTQRAADRLTSWGVDPDRILRTDRGDDENDVGQWVYKTIAGCHDQAGDDDVEVWLPREATQPVRVQYKTPSTTC
jgi:beta-lactamase superfamily II metal-dependent hydrolase